VAFAVLVIVPQAWATAALIAALVVVSVLRAVRASSADVLRAADADEEAISLGTDAAGRKVVLSEAQLAAHGVIVGASGAGKSTTLLRILCEQVATGRAAVAVDLKGSPAFAGQLAAAAARAGRPYTLWTLDGPSYWNPLEHGSATELKDKLVATERFTEPHYQRAAERYVQTVLQALLHARRHRAPTLAQVVRFMDPHRLPSLLRGLPGPLAERVQDYLVELTPDQLSAVRGLATRLALITESDAGRHLLPPPSAPEGAPSSPGVVDLRRALAGEEIVLFSLNSSRYGRLAAQIGTLAVQDLVAAVGHRLEHMQDVGSGSLAIVGIDEFSALGGDQVISLLARGREARASVVLATQELADLDRAAVGLRDQVLGNTAVKVAHRQDVPSSAQMIAQMAGTQKAWEETLQLRGGLLAAYAGGRGTRRQVEQFVVHPNAIKTLASGEAVLITKLPHASTRMLRVSRPAPLL